MEEVNRLLIKLVPGTTSATAPPLTDVTTLGNSVARHSPKLAADQGAGVPSLTEDQVAGIPPLLEDQAAAHRSLVLPSPSTEGQAGAPLIHGWSRGLLFGR